MLNVKSQFYNTTVMRRLAFCARKRKELAAKEYLKAKLKALKNIVLLVLNDNTGLHGIPSLAWA
jgi:hypothetical protein